MLAMKTQRGPTGMSGLRGSGRTSLADRSASPMRLDRRRHLTEGGRVVSEGLARVHQESLDLPASSPQGTR